MMNNHVIENVTYLDNRSLERKNPSPLFNGEGFFLIAKSLTICFSVARPGVEPGTS